jgi:hypothetical protein
MFQEALDEKLNANAPLSDDSIEKWCKFKNITTETAKVILEPKEASASGLV